MKQNKDVKKEDKILRIIGICLVVLIILLLLIFQVLLPNLQKEKVNENYVSDSQISIDDLEKPSENEWIDLQLSGEQSRIEYYLGTWISTMIGNEKYELGYQLLNAEFKNNYFPTLEDFENYAKQTYPFSMILDYSDVQRQGNYYIAKVTITDVLNEKETFTQRFIVKENGFNDYEISFTK